MLLKWIVFGIPLTVLAFLVGAYSDDGTRRLLFRLILNVYLAGLMILVSSDPEYVLGSAIVDDPVSIRGMDIIMDASPIALILLIIPACSIIDAVVEYRDGTRGQASPVDDHDKE